MNTLCVIFTVVCQVLLSAYYFGLLTVRFIEEAAVSLMLPDKCDTVLTFLIGGFILQVAMIILDAGSRVT